jgi:DNA-binding CsgD family transcriptional regulator
VTSASTPFTPEQSNLIQSYGKFLVPSVYEATRIYFKKKPSARGIVGFDFAHNLFMDNLFRFAKKYCENRPDESFGKYVKDGILLADRHVDKVVMRKRRRPMARSLGSLVRDGNGVMIGTVEDTLVAPECETDVVEQLIAKETYESLLRGLSERDRTVVQMKIKGYSRREIASAIGKCEETVSANVRSIKERLHVILDRDN